MLFLEFIRIFPDFSGPVGQSVLFIYRGLSLLGTVQPHPRSCEYFHIYPDLSDFLCSTGPVLATYLIRIRVHSHSLPHNNIYVFIPIFPIYLTLVAGHVILTQFENHPRGVFKLFPYRGCL